MRRQGNLSAKSSANRQGSGLVTNSEWLFFRVSMKALSITLCTILILVGLFPAYFPIAAQPHRIPHQNPATARESPELSSLLLFYGNVFDRAAARDYRDAQSILKDVEYANIPAALRDIIDSYNAISSRLLTTMNNLEYLLNETSNLFANNQLSEARQKLDDAEATTRNAQFLMEDIEAATNTLGDKLNVFAALPDSRIRQSYDRLKDKLHRLTQLIDELNQLREKLAADPQTAVAASFYRPTFLEISAPESALPGLPITVTGRVSSSDELGDRTVRVLFDNTLLTTKVVQQQFSLQITIPPEIATGEHSLTLVAVAEEHYAGTSRTLPVHISRIPVRTETQVSPTTIIPESIEVSGKVYRDLEPLEDVWVRVTFKDSSAVLKTAADGSFSTSLRTHLDLSLAGPQELTIVIRPAEPWYTPLEVKRWTLAVNPLSLALIALVSVLLGLLVFRRTRDSGRRPGQGVFPSKAGPPEPLISAITPRRKYEFDSIRDRIVSAYLTVLRTVERVTGVSMAPQDTVREFLDMIITRLPVTIKPLVELTTVVENALYSARELDENIASRAELLADTIQQELQGGAT